MPITKDALKKLRSHYSANKDSLPSQQRIADMSGLSESTVQRALSGNTDSIKFETVMRIAPVIGMTTEDLGVSDDAVAAMDNDDMRALVIALREINIRELAAQREADDVRWRERLDSDQRKHHERIEMLGKQHTQEIASIVSAHNSEMQRCRERHDEHVTQIHQMYDRQMESMRQANAKQMEMMLEGHAKQIEAIQTVDAAQQEAVQRMANTQMAADEKSKDFLKKEITQRDSRIKALDKRDTVKNVIIFSLIAMIFLLFIVDFFMPSVGWIRRTTQTLFGYHYYG
ncbi:MAG: helix-turn-helix domain-containing protein [Clostridia bacterium]|nr:helix-turn-helix domain-containing protein [Clostridia bacterium]